MTTAIQFRARPERVAWHPVLGLAAIEARRYAMRVSIWIGWVLTVSEASFNHPDWPGGSYETVLPLSFAPMLLGVFIAAVRTGARDADPDLPPLAEEAAVDVDDRHAARLLGLAMPAALALLTTIGIAIVSRIEGGFWLGDVPYRTDTAVHSPLELLQPSLLVLLAGALGVVTGRALRRPLLGIVIGAFTWFLLFPAYWIWNTPPLNVIAPAQIMPLRVGIGRILNRSEIPADWSVSPPNEYQSEYEHQVVHLPTVAFHHLYLVGLIMIVAAGVARGRRRTVRIAGIAVTIVGVVAQLAVSPQAWTG